MKNKQIFWNKTKNAIIKAKNFSLDLLFPPKLKCIFCGIDIPDFEDNPYCDKCAELGILNDKKRCKICDVEIGGLAEVCDFCKSRPHTFDKAFCPFVYDNIVRNAILKFKDDDGKYLAPIFAQYIAEEIKAANISIDIIIPVPLHSKTLKARGYNQAELLAIEVGKLIGAPVNTKVILKTNLTAKQKSLDYKSRQQNLAASFTLTSPYEIKNKNVLIIDDVLTTCATVNAICHLIKEKANNIYVGAIARTKYEEN